MNAVFEMVMEIFKGTCSQLGEVCFQFLFILNFVHSLSFSLHIFPSCSESQLVIHDSKVIIPLYMYIKVDELIKSSPTYIK